jgi:uncharacterized protein YndB with AHSA1/START domain
MAKNISTITINATKQRIWDTLTKRELVKLWQYGSDLKTTWEVGSNIEFETKWEEKIFKQWGTVLEFSPTDKLAYNLFAPRPGLDDKPENYFIMTYVLTGIGDKTKIVIIQEDDRPNAVQEPPQGDENPILQAIKKLAEAS